MWTPQRVTEIIDKLNAVSEENRADVARNLIEAESSRGESAREELLTALAQVVEPTSSPATGNGSSEEAGGPEDETGGEGEDLIEFVSTNTVEAVLERVGDDSGLATAYREAEESRGDKSRPTLIKQLTKIEYPEA